VNRGPAYILLPYELDIVAVNDMKNEIVVAKIKMNPSRINTSVLKQKSKRLIERYPEYRPKWIGLSLKDALKYLSSSF